MMRTFLSSNIPDEVIEAARIDGAGELKILARVVLPLAKPIVATLAMLVGLEMCIRDRHKPIRFWKRRAVLCIRNRNSAG